MCNFIGATVSKIQFIRLKQIEKELGSLAAMQELGQMIDGFKYSNTLIIRANTNHTDIEIIPAHWEFIPVWIKDMDALKISRKQGIPWLNATSEKLLESKMFRNAALKRRCLVPATHFYEWRNYQPEGAKKEQAYPYAIELKNGNAFYLAAIWQTWTDKSTGETMDTFAIVTTKANALMYEVHNKKHRMPTILTENLAYEWVMVDLSEQRILEIASYQYPANEMHAYSVAKNFKISENPLEPFTYSELPAITMVS